MITQDEILDKINGKTKPVASLGRLEELAMQICKIQDTLSPQLVEPAIFIFAADHGIANEGVSAYPQEVTWQMVYNFLQGGAAINVLARQHNLGLRIIDAGVNKDFDNPEGLTNLKVGFGTRNFLKEEAMSVSELRKCFENGKNLLIGFKKTSKSNIVGFGEMGIGNTSSAALLMHCLTGVSLENCIGKGTGLDEEQLKHKKKILKKALKYHQNLNKNNVGEVMQTFGGFEIAMMTSAMLEACEQDMVLMIDGFIASVAFLAAFKINPEIIKNAVFCHQSEEKGHRFLLDYLEAKPILSLQMRLGEGTGCAVAYPIIQSAVNFMNEMASFESAMVSNKE